jgi:hypothetical protein
MSQTEDELRFQKISCKIPRSLWREGKIRAMDEGCDFQDVVIRALELYLQAPAKRGRGVR